MTSSPRSLNFTSRDSSRWVPTSTSTSPAAQRARIAFCSVGVRNRLIVSSPDGKIAEPFAEGFAVLLGQQGRRAQNRHLLAGRHGLEGRADGHFGLAESHVPAYQAVHGLGILHVLLGVGDGRQLVRGFLEEERILQGLLQGRVTREKHNPGRALRAA